MAKKTKTVTTRVVNPEPESRIVQQSTTTRVTPELGSRTVQQTTTTRVTPEPEPRVVEKTETVEKKGVFGGTKTTVKRDTVIED